MVIFHNYFVPGWRHGLHCQLDCGIPMFPEGVIYHLIVFYTDRYQYLLVYWLRLWHGYQVLCL